MLNATKDNLIVTGLENRLDVEELLILSPRSGAFTTNKNSVVIQQNHRLILTLTKSVLFFNHSDELIGLALIGRQIPVMIVLRLPSKRTVTHHSSTYGVFQSDLRPQGPNQLTSWYFP